jgi:hypothetical protein
MAIDGHIVQQPDDWKINMSDAWQVLWWSRYLGLTKSQLEDVIEAAGPVIINVKQYLAHKDESLTDMAPVMAPAGASHVISRIMLTRSPF